MAIVAALVIPAAAPAAPFERSEAEWLTHIQNYLNLISTVEASFLQVSSNGEFGRGRVYIERPGRMRVEYDPPSPSLIVANHGILTYLDRDLGQTSHVPLSSTPAAILLAPSIKLNGGPVKVTNLLVRDELVQLTLVETDNPGEGTLTLVFSETPLTLKEWTVIDAQGISTTVTLENATFDKPLQQSLFEIDDPKFR